MNYNWVYIITLLFSSNFHSVLCFGQKQSVKCDLIFENASKDENIYLVNTSFNKIQVDTVDSEGDIFSYYKFDIYEVVPSTKWRTKDIDTIKKYRSDIQIIKPNNNAGFLLRYDKNANQTYTDDTAYILNSNKSEIIPFELRISHNEVVNINIVVEIAMLSSGIDLRVRPLLKYKIKEPIDATIFPNTFFTTIVIDSNNYRPNEFIPIDTGWITIDSLDYINKSASISFYSAKERPIGTRVDYYANLSRVKLFTTSDNALIKKWKTTKTGYSLLHFWGPWCAPCRKEYNIVLNLNRFLKETNVTFVNYAFCFDSTDVETSYRLIEEGKVPDNQCVFIPSKECQFDNPYIDGCNIIHILDVFNYPDYILLDSEGKVLYRGVYGKELMELVNKIIKK